MEDEILVDTQNDTSYSIKDVAILRSFAKYLKPYLFVFVLLIFFDVIVNFCWTGEPFIFSLAIDSITSLEEGKISADEARNTFLHLALIDISMLTIASFGTYLVNYHLRKIGQNIIYDFRNDMFSHVLSLSQKQLKSLKIGSFVTRVTNDTQNLSTFFTDILPNLVRNILSLITILGISFFKAGVYGWIFVCYLPIVLLISFFFQKKARKYYLGEKNAISKMNSFLSESFSGISVIKTYHKEEKKAKEFEERNMDIYSHYTKSQNLFAFFYPMMYLLQMSSTLLIISFAIPAVYKETMLIGTFYLLITYSGQFFQPIQQLSQIVNNLQTILSSASRTQYVLDMKPEIVNGDDVIDVPSFKGKVEFRHVYFKYEDGQDYVLKDVSFVIYPGKTVAFVGPTGAGKSTIISLISRTYEPQQGEILIDDIDIKKYSLECLRRNIGLMMQDVFLFSGTVLDNISLENPDISEKEVIENSKRVGADIVVKRLKDGYHEKVTERGENFSAGERQLISFARTLTYSPSLMLLDEATANIDTETENIIENSLEELSSVSTMIIVAHRLSTIKRADHIFVIKKGSIIEEGNHQELLKLKGTYYNLYRLQNMEKTIGMEDNENENNQNL